MIDDLDLSPQFVSSIQADGWLGDILEVFEVTTPGDVFDDDPYEQCLSFIPVQNSHAEAQSPSDSNQNLGTVSSLVLSLATALSSNKDQRNPKSSPSRSSKRLNPSFGFLDSDTNSSDPASLTGSYAVDVTKAKSKPSRKK
jgi:hypothetical protein